MRGKKKPSFEVNSPAYFEKFASGKVSFFIKEAYKTARTNIMFSTKSKDDSKKVLLSSPEPGEGKSTTCISLAISFCQMNAKVLLIDADLRKPTVHKKLKLRNDVGLSTVLSNFNEVGEVIKKTEHGFECITAGPIPPNPAELLSSEDFDELLKNLGKEYDYIFIDSPPINLVSDACIISKFVTGTILVVRDNYTRFPSVDRAIKSLEFVDAKILGLILNDVNDIADENSYKYKYKRYGYGYGYKDI